MDIRFSSNIPNFNRCVTILNTFWCLTIEWSTSLCGVIYNHRRTGVKTFRLFLKIWRPQILQVNQHMCISLYFCLSVKGVQSIHHVIYFFFSRTSAHTRCMNSPFCVISDDFLFFSFPLQHMKRELPLFLSLQSPVSFYSTSARTSLSVVSLWTQPAFKYPSVMWFLP
jgi:hypothetical protein